MFLLLERGIAEGLLWRGGFLQSWRWVVCAAQCCWGTGAAKCVVGKVVVAQAKWGPRWLCYPYACLRQCLRANVTHECVGVCLWSSPQSLLLGSYCITSLWSNRPAKVDAVFCSQGKHQMQTDLAHAHVLSEARMMDLVPTTLVFARSFVSDQ